ncbi:MULTISPECIES: aldo/keto reductase [unclassified Thermoactinomyces]|uniref:aldo/keto reductase n=1 Tax=unclassified Thermoactinomyces TaxID=2634588 RepID=UPI0018DD2C58|nr:MULTISPECIES: aldo/keto reductase [unclassified Thermoactinomyces]MBH8599296.1 aldo/keto reductase [Thermoactinomyces sp. CICC 10523]MBH8605348.1 aldo/keto reductase [Thermoactinomyces sp. CICC 10522]MBH8608804.1 aldo/keto reductase [Thermoactinomyces sp. CICC 10521]
MKHAIMKKAGLKVSRIGLGTNAVGGYNLFSNIQEENGRKLVYEALEQGINFFDTADAYGFGRSEEILGEILHDQRDNVVIATKGGIEKLDDGTIRHNNKPEYLRSAVEKSLRRLRTDYIDLYYIHYIDPEVPLAESIGELSRLREEGKIKAIGVSNVDFGQLREANADNHVSVVQLPYNMLDRTAEKELLPYCVEHGISFVPYGPLAFGILGGKYTRDFVLEDGDWRKDVALFEPANFQSILHKVEQLKQVAVEKETTVAGLALAWLLAQPGVDTVIPGGKRPEQVAENITAVQVNLSGADLERINQILAN